MTVLEAIQKSAEFLGKKGVESPRLQAEMLLAHLLKVPRLKLYLNFERAMSPAETDALRQLVKRRGAREPLQHILGTTSFCGYEMAVNRHALVPRPETELLAEEGWKFLQERAAAGRSPTVLDFGTGTGCLAIALAAQCPASRIVATDISPEALALAEANAVQNKVADRIEFVLGDGFAPLPKGWPFDLIISNPPYIPTSEIETLAPEVKHFDPRAALDGGSDGLDFYRMFATQAGTFLKPDGRLLLEFGDGQAEAIRKILEAQKWIVEAVKEDYSHRERVLIAKL
ncbi:MAG TPA: peptide chain release factor N(5)-glutamine methyltransferase [Verrucomicrobiae bacterium]|nr:peptide chain release factor N(5)-glutamine methyltransferase [Verrucomicrobiae bacterium]